MKQLNKYYLEEHEPDIPDGKTVEPTDDIQIWIHCAGRKDAYTSLADVLADSTCLAALMADDNAVDYLVRSTTWTTMCSNLDAMAEIGANNYAANTLLDDSTWRPAICNSIYFESVLNVKVPVMTSNTTPSGRVVSTANSSYSSGRTWYPYDGNDNTQWNGQEENYGTCHNGYIFTEPVHVYKLHYAFKDAYDQNITYRIKYQATADGVTWTDITSQLSYTCRSYAAFSGDILLESFATAYTGYRILFTYSSNAYAYTFNVNTLQFYGRKDI